MRLRQLLGALVALLILCACAPQAEAARAPRAFYGVMAAQDPTPAEIDRMGEGRVGTLRVNFVWGAVQPSASAPLDWRYYDAIIGEAAAQGIQVLPTVYSSPRWAADRPNHPPKRSRYDEFRTFVSAAVERYGPGGSFWAANPSIPPVPVIWWQLWNEPNFPNFWNRKANPKQYVHLLRAFHRAVRAGNPAAKVVLAGLFPTAGDQVKRGINLEPYLTSIYRHRGKKLFDAAAIHPYAGSPSKARDLIKDMRRTMNRFKDRRTPIWVTEIGWANGGERTGLTVGSKRQAAYVRQTFGQLAKNRRRLKIAGVIWYSWRDLPGGIWFNHTGLFTEGNGPKPAWKAFVGLTGGSAG
ncbi:MAG TPA: cellulase family glycosylhydrolase [Solirubrobacterales bacterium]